MAYRRLGLPPHPACASSGSRPVLGTVAHQPGESLDKNHHFAVIDGLSVDEAAYLVDRIQLVAPLPDVLALYSAQSAHAAAG
jgi:hypothetical protein